MKLSRALFILAIIVGAGFATGVHAQERGTLSARSGSSDAVRFRQAQPSYRSSDTGRCLKAWCQQVVYRATNDTFVYRYEGQATTRDEYSSPVLIFHAKGGEVRAGHVYSKRDN